MANVQFADVEPLLHTYYEKKKGEIIFHPECDPIIAYCKLVGKDSAGGSDKIVVNVTDDGNSVQSPDYALADGGMAAYRFEITPNIINWRATVSQSAIDGAEGSPTGLYDVLKDQTTRQIRKTMDKFARHALSIGGAIGKVANKSGQTFQLAGAVNGVVDTNLTNRIFVGQKLNAAAAVLTGNQRGTNVGGYGDTVTVASWVDDTGVVTVTGDLTNFANGDFLFEKGDRYYAGSTGRRAIAGVPEWFSAVAPTPSESFFAQDRSLSPSLQALRFDADGMDIREALRQARQRLYTKGLVNADTVWIASQQYAELEAIVEKTAICDFDMVAEGEGGRKLVIGLQGIKLTNGRGGSMMVVQLPRLESGTAYMFNKAQNGFIIGYTDQFIRTHNVGGMWRAVEGGVADGNGVENVAAYRCEGSLRACLYASGAGAGSAVALFNLFGT